MQTPPDCKVSYNYSTLSCGFSLFAGERPTLLKLLNFPGKSGNINIPERIGTKYIHFGSLLLNDKTGAELSVIIAQCKDINAEQITLEVLKLWVGGKGRPLSWDTLIDVLIAIGLNPLACEIQDLLEVPDHKHKCELLPVH